MRSTTPQRVFGVHVRKVVDDFLKSKLKQKRVARADGHQLFELGICVYMFLCTYVRMYVCMYVRLYVYVCTYVCMYVCMYVSVYVCSLY